MKKRQKKNTRLSIDVTNCPYFREYLKGKTLQSKIMRLHEDLISGKGNICDRGVPMTGWKHLPLVMKSSELSEISKTAKKLSQKIDVFLSLGIGGSYLGTEALTNALLDRRHNQQKKAVRKNPEIYFLGQNMDSDFFKETCDLIKSKRFGVNVISKSGTTTETAVAFRIVKKMLTKKYGKRAKSFVVVTTDKEKGALRAFAGESGCAAFVLPDNIGGRYSVTSVVGLFGAAVAGINIAEFIRGARAMEKHIRKLSKTPAKNPAFVRAALRYLAHRRHKKDIEIVAANCEKLKSMTYWLEQLYPESEGKNGVGLWVAPSMYSEKAHANGQMVQSGKRNIIETFIQLKATAHKVTIPREKGSSDGLDYISGRTMSFINDKVIEGLKYAHTRGGVPNITISIPKLDAYHLGEFIQLEMNACALSSMLLGQNPFIQPGVEAYKDAMFALSGKPGRQKAARAIRKALLRRKTIIR